MKKFIWSLILFLILIVGLGVYIINFPKADISAKSIDVNINAAALYKNYSANEPEGNKKYIDKILLTEGKIIDISKDEMDATVFLLAEENEPGGVLCTFEKGQKTAMYQLGDNVKVKGKCTGMLMDVVLNKCVLQ